MILEDIKIAKLYNYINNLLILLGITLIFTKINVVGIFTVGILINTIIFIAFNPKISIEIISRDFKRILLFLIFPLYLCIMNIAHGDNIFFLFQIWIILLILPFITIFLREFYKVRLDYLYYAFILSGIVLIIRIILYLLYNSSDRFDSITSLQHNSFGAFSRYILRNMFVFIFRTFKQEGI